MGSKGMRRLVGFKKLGLAVGWTLLLFLCSEAHALLMPSPRPEVAEILVDPDDTANMFMIVRVPIWRDSQEKLLGIESRDGGRTFSEADLHAIPRSLVNEVSSPRIRYVLTHLDAPGTERMLWGSEDGGKPWQGMALADYLDRIADEQSSRDRKAFLERFGGRLPEQSVYWKPIYVSISLLYVIAAVVLLSKGGWVNAVLSAMRSGIVLCFAGAAWCAIAFVGEAMIGLQSEPTVVLGFLMHIACRPLPLAAMLVPTVAFLPSTIHIVRLWKRPGPDQRPRLFVLWLFVLWYIACAAFWAGVICSAFYAMMHMVV